MGTMESLPCNKSSDEYMEEIVNQENVISKLLEQFDSLTSKPKKRAKIENDLIHAMIGLRFLKLDCHLAIDRENYQNALGETSENIFKTIKENEEILNLFLDQIHEHKEPSETLEYLKCKAYSLHKKIILEKLRFRNAFARETS